MIILLKYNLIYKKLNYFHNNLKISLKNNIKMIKFKLKIN